MNVPIPPDLESAVNDEARRLGVAPEAVVVAVLRGRFNATTPLFEPRDDWERTLLGLAIAPAAAFSNEELSRERQYGE